MCQINHAPRILFVHEHFGAFGGAEANIRITAGELKRRGYKLGLLYARATGKDAEAWRGLFDEVFHLPKSGVTRGVQAFNPSLIYLHNLGDLTQLEELLGCGLPVVRMVHDHSMYCLRTYKYNYFTRRICKKPASLQCIFPCLASVVRNPGGSFPIKWASLRAKQREIALNRQCDQFVVYSDYSRQELIRNGFDPGRIHVHVPIPCEGEKAPLSTFSQANIILFAGQIIRGKGVDVLLQSLSKVRTPFQAIILGEGNHRARCERLAQRLGLADRVTFKGYVSPDQISGFYLQASVFAVSSLWPEPFGMVGPEAMRYGLPVVAFDAGGIGEWLINGENGYLVTWGNTDEYAARIDELLQNKDLGRALGRNGRDRVNRVYDSRHQVNVLEGLFGSLMSVPRNRSEKIPAFSI